MQIKKKIKLILFIYNLIMSHMVFLMNELNENYPSNESDIEFENRLMEENDRYYKSMENIGLISRELRKKIKNNIIKKIE